MIRTRDRAVQASSGRGCKDQTTQIGYSTGSYSRKLSSVRNITYRYLLNNIINDKESAIQWSMDIGLLKKEMFCPICNSSMKWTKCNSYSSDQYKWRCQKSNHVKDISIRHSSWFSNSNMTIEEILEFTYWWTTGIYYYHLVIFLYIF